MLSTSSESIFKDMQRIADRVKSDVERQLSEAFKTFDVIEDLSPSNIKPDDRTYYNMRIKTDDNGHVKVKTMRKDPGSDWKVEVEEYDKGNKPIEGGYKKSLYSGEGKGELDFYNDMQSAANKIKKDVEKQLSEAFKTFEAYENKFAIKTNEGDLKVKTLQYEPGSNAKVEVEKYEKEKPIESKKQKSWPEYGFFNDMQKIADKFQSFIENQLNQSFKTFEVIENRLKIKTDDNGQVQVKASQYAEPGSEVKVEVEEFNKGSRVPSEGEKGKEGKMTVEH